MANEYKRIGKMRKGMRTRVIPLISIVEMSNCLFIFGITTKIFEQLHLNVFVVI